MPPRPEDIRNRMQAARSRGVTGIPAPPRAPAPDDEVLPPLPEVSTTIPQDVMQIMERRGDRAGSHTAPLPNWRVTFVSTEPPVDAT